MSPTSPALRQSDTVVDYSNQTKWMYISMWFWKWTRCPYTISRIVTHIRSNVSWKCVSHASLRRFVTTSLTKVIHMSNRFVLVLYFAPDWETSWLYGKYSMTLFLYSVCSMRTVIYVKIVHVETYTWLDI